MTQIVLTNVLSVGSLIIMKCNNPYCPIDYNPKKEPCKGCDHSVDELKDDEAIKFFTDLFNVDTNEKQL